MGLTRFKGPVYGAKSLLWAYGPVACDTPSTAANSTAIYKNGAKRIVPPYEDWYVTEFYADMSTMSSINTHTLILKSKGGSTSITPNPDGPGAGSTITQTVATATNPTATSTTAAVLVTVTGTANEYEGLWVPAGSTMWVAYSHAGSTTAEVMTGGWQVTGFIRFRNSTRGEGG